MLDCSQSPWASVFLFNIRAIFWFQPGPLLASHRSPNTRTGQQALGAVAACCTEFPSGPRSTPAPQQGYTGEAKGEAEGEMEAPHQDPARMAAVAPDVPATENHTKEDRPGAGRWRRTGEGTELTMSQPLLQGSRCYFMTFAQEVKIMPSADWPSMG